MVEVVDRGGRIEKQDNANEIARKLLALPFCVSFLPRPDGCWPTPGIIESSSSIVFERVN
jgi:hypothetical protein